MASFAAPFLFGIGLAGWKFGVGTSYLVLFDAPASDLSLCPRLEPIESSSSEEEGISITTWRLISLDFVSAGDVAIVRMICIAYPRQFRLLPLRQLIDPELLDLPVSMAEAKPWIFALHDNLETLLPIKTGRVPGFRYLATTVHVRPERVGIFA